MTASYPGSVAALSESITALSENLAGGLSGQFSKRGRNASREDQTSSNSSQWTYDVSLTDMCDGFGLEDCVQILYRFSNNTDGYSRWGTPSTELKNWSR